MPANTECRVSKCGHSIEPSTIAIEHCRPPSRRHRQTTLYKVESLTETRHEVVKHAEDGGLPAKRHVEGAVNGDGGGNSEDGNGEVVELIVPVVPGDWGTLFLVLDGPGDVVVGDVGVDGLFILCVGGNGHGGGRDGGLHGGRRSVDDGRHGCGGGGRGGGSSVASLRLYTTDLFVGASVGGSKRFSQTWHRHFRRDPSRPFPTPHFPCPIFLPTLSCPQLSWNAQHSPYSPHVLSVARSV